MTTEPSRLATYGTLRPGESAFGLLAPLGGSWTHGFVVGWLSLDGFGRTGGYPGVILDPEGERIPVAVLESPLLERWWDAVDDYEGPDYERVVAQVVDADGHPVTTAQLYVVR